VQHWPVCHQQSSFIDPMGHYVEADVIEDAVCVALDGVDVHING
jgi:hypothetical protein